jgi:hypothetical protein
MDRPHTVWPRILAGFGLGFFAGVTAEYLVHPGSTVGLIAVLGVVAGISAGVFAAVLPEFFARGREHRLFLREHAELLRSQVYVPLISSRTTISGGTLNPTEVTLDLQGRGGPDWGWFPAGRGPIPITDFSNWDLGESHIKSDSSLSGLFDQLWGRLTERVGRKAAMDSLYTQKLSERIEAIYGRGFVVGSTFTAPEPPKWLNAAVLVTWLRRGTIAYEFDEQVSGNQHRVVGGSMIVLTSDQPFPSPATEMSRVLTESSHDPELQGVWASWMQEDSQDQLCLNEFLRAVKLAGERIQATHTIEGHCEVCLPTDR